MRLTLLTVGVVLFAHGLCYAGTLPKEPEFDNGEYMLDLVTNRYNRLWREIYDAGDNRFRFRLGSNSFEQWFLEEELKFSTTLTPRLRFRFHHARFFRNSSEQISDDTFEFEGRPFGNFYVSLFATPTFFKAENSIGLMLQRRRAINQYTILFVEFPQLVRNFTEREKGGPDSVITIFTDKPIRLGVDLREPIGSHVWVRVAGEYIPSFGMIDQIKATGEEIAREHVKAAGIMGWIEYVWGSELEPNEQTAVGIDWGVREEESTRLFGGQSSVPGREPGTAQGGLQMAPRLLEMEIDDDLFDRGVDDTIRAWHEERFRLQPYLWWTLNKRFTVRATVRGEQREITWTPVAGSRHRLKTDYVVTSVGLRMHFGSRRQSIIEAGTASEFRKRIEEIGVMSTTTRHDDHRAYISFEYAFDDSKRIRVIEALELDGEDIGNLTIHDHGFLQMIFGF